MADIPSPLTYGTIIGHYVSFLADSADAGFAPDMDTLNGSVTITSNLRVAQVAATGTNYLAVQKPIVAKIVNGVLYAPDGTTTSVCSPQTLRVLHRHRSSTLPHIRFLG
jgi:hypothetical protein